MVSFTSLSIMLCMVRGLAVQLKESELKENSQLGLGLLTQSITDRFAKMDLDQDGVLTLEEMRADFPGKVPEKYTDRVLRRMLEDCSGRTGAESCRKQELKKALKLWTTSGEAESAINRLTERDYSEAFVEVDEEAADVGQNCGMAASPNNLLLREFRQCKIFGIRCTNESTWLSWNMEELCVNRACICTPTKMARRLAKVGVAGALAAMTVANSSDRGVMNMPACGRGWQGVPVVGEVSPFILEAAERDPNMTLGFEQELDTLVDDEDNLTKKALVRNSQGTSKTEVMLYKSHLHRIEATGKLDNICMISWQSEKDILDLKAMGLWKPINFTYGPADMGVKMPAGAVIQYDSVREQLKATVQRECCSERFTASKLVISGYSLGGVLAELNAIDAITNWECHRADLNSDNIAVVVVGATNDMPAMSAVNHLYSCADKNKCLAGSVVQLVMQNDMLGRSESDAAFFHPLLYPPRHPALPIRLPCSRSPDVSGPFDYRSKAKNMQRWCHSIGNFVGEFEKHYVRNAGWGSSCSGACGQPSAQVQCAQHVRQSGTSCGLVDPAFLPQYTECKETAWDKKSETCACKIDRCYMLTHDGRCFA